MGSAGKIFDINIVLMRYEPLFGGALGFVQF